MGPLGVGAFPDEEWDCFGKILANEVQYCSSQLLVEDDGNVGMQSMFCSILDAAGGNKNRFYSFDSNDSNFQYLSQERSHNGNCSGHSVFMANPDHTKYYFDQVLANSTSMSFCMMDDKNSGSCVQSDIVMKDERSDKSEISDHSQVELTVSPAKHLKLKRKLDVPQLKVQLEDKIASHGNCNKKPRVSNDVKLCMKNWKLDKNGNQAEETNAGSDHGRSSSSYTQEDDNVSHENSRGATSALNSKGKTKATRGSATDPQSLYARKRRERINERLRILQNLVPNGTKVDISTMLEEAVHYVKFLQLQIKLTRHKLCKIE